MSAAFLFVLLFITDFKLFCCIYRSTGIACYNDVGFLFLQYILDIQEIIEDGPFVQDIVDARMRSLLRRRDNAIDARDVQSYQRAKIVAMMRSEAIPFIPRLLITAWHHALLRTVNLLLQCVILRF